MVDKDKKAKLKTVKNWEKELNVKLEYQLNGSNVIKLWCVVCKKWESCIKHSKNFNDAWIHRGTESIKKDSLKSHVTSKQHMKAVIIKKSELGASAYVENVVSTTPIGCGLQRMCLQGNDLDSL